MKPHPATGKCQRNGCTRVGPQRFDARLKRTLFVCAVCFESLQAYELRKLFRDVGADAKN
jgi:hypothetical protein